MAGKLVLGKTMIYFVQAEHGGPIKIGRADKPEERLRDLQIGNPYRLRLTRTVEGVRIDEWRLHRLFAPLRLQGEWFKPHPVLAAMADAKEDPSLADEPIIYDDNLISAPTLFTHERRAFLRREGYVLGERGWIEPVPSAPPLS